MMTKIKTRKTSTVATTEELPHIVIPDLKDFEEKGWKIYDKLRPKLEKRHAGKVVAIEPESRDYVVDNHAEDATRTLEAKHPDKLLFCTRIGGGAVWRFRNYDSMTARY